MDEQLLRIRMAALAAAARWSAARPGGAAPLDIADLFERWLTRPPAVEVTTLDDADQVFIKVNESTGQDVPPKRAECGAFLRPPWYTDAQQSASPWLVCSDEHTVPAGWHLDTGTGTFASHHWVGRAGRECACGGTEWPCPRSDPSDMRT